MDPKHYIMGKFLVSLKTIPCYYSLTRWLLVNGLSMGTLKIILTNLNVHYTLLKNQMTTAQLVVELNKDPVKILLTNP